MSKYENIAENYYNGNRKDACQLFKKLGSYEKAEFIDWITEIYEAMDAINFLKSYFRTLENLKRVKK